MSVIEVEQLTKIFRRGDEEIYALHEISFKVNPGDFVAITGPSGSGKSTLLYLLGLLDKPDGGKYLLDGEETAHLSDDERAKLRNQKLGFIFQNFHLLPRATALRNVTMPLVYSASYDHSFSEEKMTKLGEEALSKVGLSDRMTHVPNQLSGGQRQRVAIARALVNRPRILFADEPTGNLDSKTGRDILEIFKTLHSEGVTILLVTHDPQVALIARRQLKLRDGKIESYE